MMLGLMLAAVTAVQTENVVTAGAVPAQATISAAADGAGIQSFPASFFADSRPNTAVDMLERLPGFSFDGGDGGVRGFAGAAGNVLIDGERPSSKSVRLQDIVRRIPAKSVERIEVIRGGAPGIDMQGQTLVANIVRSKAAASTFGYIIRPRIYGDGWIAPRFDIEATRRQGPLSLQGVLRAEWNADPESGSGRRIVMLPNGTVRSSVPLFSQERGRTLTATGAAELDTGPDTWRLNLGGEHEQEKSLQTVGPERITEFRRAWSLEGSGDYERQLSERSTLRLLALHTLEDQTGSDQSAEAGDSETADTDERSSESIVRASLTTRPFEALTLEGGGEGALNILDAKSAFTENGAPVVVPNANVRIEEKRAEAFASARFTASPRLTTEAGLRVETSQISQTGDTRLTRSFTFIKPRASATYSATDTTQIRLRLEREVGQLDFGDFAASAELDISSVNAGNANLEPERAWVMEASLEQQFWDKGAIAIAYTHSRVQRVVDLIPVAGRFDAPGNIGDGKRDQLKVTSTLPLDRVGLPGGLLVIDATWLRSSVKDPVTGAKRTIAADKPFEGSVRYTHDIASLNSTLGIEGEFATESTSFRIDEVRKTEFQSLWTVYWDWKAWNGASLRLQYENLTGREFQRRRVLYDGPRSRNVVEAIDYRYAKLDPFITVRLRQTF
jgi:outer membrane receptor protein involved in Fe transport